MPNESDDAVSDVLGNVLLVGITVSMAVGFSLFVSNLPGPPDEVFAELKINADPGLDRNWGTGDETIEIKHLYGESLHQDHVKLIYSVNDVTTTMTGSALSFSGQTLDIGEKWSHGLLLQNNDEITINLVVPHGSGSRLMVASDIVTGQASCGLDNDPPHAVISQVPANLEALTGTDPVNITAVLIDVCSSVDQTVTPNLWYDVVGSPQSVVMTKVGPDRFYGLIPPPTGHWATEIGQTLKYQIQGMRDNLGNAGGSPVFADFVDPIPPTYHYVSGIQPHIGSVSNFANMQSASDGGASGILAEGLAPGGDSVESYYATTVVNGVGWDKPAQAAAGTLELDDDNAIYKENLDEPIRLGLADPGASSDAIKKVIIKAEGYQPGWIDDGWQVQGCTNVGCTVISGVRPAWGIESLNVLPQANAVFEFDVTNFRPGGGSWTWEDINALEVIITPRIVFTPLPGPGPDPDGKWELDSTWVEVTRGPGYDLDVDLTWTGIPLAPQNDIELNYRAIGGQFQVEVWDGFAWSPKLPLLDGTSFTKWSHSLSLAEFQTGNPSIRIVSLQTNPHDPGNVVIDYARATS